MSKAQANRAKFAASRRETMAPSPEKDTRCFVHGLMTEDTQKFGVMQYLPRSVQKCLRSQGQASTARAVLNDWRFQVARLILAILDMLLLAWSIQDAAELIENSPYELEMGAPDSLAFVLANDVLSLLYTAELL